MTEEDRERMLVEARAWYDKAAADGIDALFEARQDRCPWCRSSNLRLRLRTREHIQLKPGRFSLDECRSCGHVFQNPRLNAAGLDYYYRDFYDGLGAEIAETMFALGGEGNRIRARAVAAHTTPGTWLDIGTGHGHFRLHAKEVLPDTVFDGLDMGEGVTVAAQTGRVRTGHRGMFPDLAPSLGSYDVVSMHHYLEHTRDPRIELDALAAVVKPGGYAEIEMPDVFSAYGRALPQLVGALVPAATPTLPAGGEPAERIDRTRFPHRQHRTRRRARTGGSHLRADLPDHTTRPRPAPAVGPGTHGDLGQAAARAGLEPAVPAHREGGQQGRRAAETAAAQAGPDQHLSHRGPQGSVMRRTGA